MTARILVVDDEPDLEALLIQKFRRQIRGGEVCFLFARDGVEALAKLEEDHDVDMVVTDINMPRMDGLLLLQKLQEKEERLSTIIVSAYGDMANIRIAMNRGAFDFLTKPIDFPDLEATIAKTVRHIEFLREAKRRLLEAERSYAALSRYFSPSPYERRSRMPARQPHHLCPQSSRHFASARIGRHLRAGGRGNKAYASASRPRMSAAPSPSSDSFEPDWPAPYRRTQSLLRQGCIARDSGAVH